MSEDRCFLCDSENVILQRYHTGGKRDRAKNIVSKAPNLFGLILPQRYREAAVDYKYFGQKKIKYCSNCNTGETVPQFSEKRLDQYYRKFYWGNKAVQDRVGLFARAKRNLPQLEDIIRQCNSVLDFGCGEAAFSVLVSQLDGGPSVLAHDKSSYSRATCKKNGIPFVDDKNAVPTNLDLLYASHSLEHVPSIDDFFRWATSRLLDRAYAFFEVPEITDREAMQRHIPHTPHTYMLSQRSFNLLADRHGFDIEKISSEGGNLRVLMRRRTV